MSDLVNSFAWIEREDGVVVPVGNIDTPMSILEVLPGVYLPGLIIDDELAAQIGPGDMLHGVINL